MRKFALLFLLTIFALAQDKALQEGEAYFQAKSYQKAINSFLQVISKGGWNEDIAKATLRIAQCYLALDDIKNARKYFETAAKDTGEIGLQAKLGLALCDIQDEKYDSAIDSLTELIDRKPPDKILPYAYYNRGIAYERKGWMVQAIEDFSETVKKGKGDDALISSAQAHLATCQARYAQFQEEENNYLQRINQSRRADEIRDLYHELARKCANIGEIDKGIEYEMKSLDYSYNDETYNAGAWMNIAWRYVMKRDYAKAAEAFTKVANDYPYSEYAPEALLRAGDMFSRVGKQEEALAVYQEFLQRYPNDPRASSVPQNIMFIAWAYADKREYEKAGVIFLSIANAFPGSEVGMEALLRVGDMFFKAGKTDDAINIYNKFIKQYPNDEGTISAMMNLAWCYAQKEDYERAAQTFKMIADNFPRSEQAPEALLRAGDMFSKAGKMDEAIKAYQDFVDKYPNDPQVPSALMNVAWRYSDKKDYAKSAEIFRKVADKYPNSEVAKEALLRAGDMFSKAGKHEDAIKAYQKFAQKYPDDEQVSKALLDIAWRYRAIYLETGDENAKKQKEAILQEIAKRFPDTEMAYFALGLYYEDNGQYNLAIEQYKKCAEKNGTQKDVALFGVATCYYDITMIKEAHEYYAKLVEECPDSPLIPNATFFRGQTSAELGDYKSAIKDYQEVKEKYPESYYAPIACAFIATAHEHLYDFRSAIKEYQEFTDVFKKAEKLPAHLRHLSSMRGVVFLRIGSCYLNLGEYEKALEVWRNIKNECPELKWVGIVADRVADSLERIKKAYGGNLPKIALKNYTPPEHTRTPVAGIITPRNVGLTRGLEGRHIIVYGTQGTEEERQSALFVAQTLQRMEIKSSRMKVDIKADVEVTEKDIKNRPLILIGTPGSNKLIEQLKEKLPVKVDKGEVIVGNRKFRGNDVGVFFVAPNPLNLESYVVVIEGLTADALRNAVNIHHDSDPNPLLIQTDYLVYDSQSGGPEKPVLEEGFFIKETIENWHPL
ncbi:tetratricopeptide repeat protein [bacterium]|nr:tetratricopeptide repeat protein [bacterium]